jgi:hypothetical protein
MTVKVMKGWFVCGRAGPFPVCASLRAGEMYDQAETQALPLVPVDEGLVLEAARARRLRRAVSTVCRDRPCLRRRPREPTRAWPSMAVSPWCWVAFTPPATENFSQNARAAPGRAA